jgi:hypothetical protein
MKWKKPSSVFVLFWLIIVSLSYGKSSGVDFFSGIESIAESLAPALKEKSTTVGLIKEKKTGSRLRFSDVLADEISIALKNKGVEVVIAEQSLGTADKQEFRMGMAVAKALIVGSFQKWGKFYVVTTQAVDTGSGKVISGKTVKIEASDVPAEMLDPVMEKGSVIGQGTASIQYQCPPNENPCPPTTELKRRAIDVARIMAMEDLSTKTGVSVSAVNQIVSGRSTNNVINTNTSSQLLNLKIHDPVIQGDEVMVKLSAEVILTNSVTK